MPSHHTLPSLSHETSKPVKHTCDSQTGATNTPGLLQFWRLVRFITATLSFVQIRNPGIVNLKMSVLVILEKTLVYLWYVLTWLCGVWRRQECVEEAHESMGDGVIRNSHQFWLNRTCLNWGEVMMTDEKWWWLMGMDTQIVLQWILFRLVHSVFYRQSLKVRKYSRPVRMLHKGSKLGGEKSLL